MAPINVLVQYLHDPDLHDYVRERVPGTMDVSFTSKSDQLENEIPGIDILYGHIDAGALKAADRLAWVQSHSTGVERMLYPEFIKRGITLTNIKGLLATPIAEHVFALLLSLTRHMDRFYENKRDRRWQTVGGYEIAGLTIGIIGLGHIGREVAIRANAFDLNVLGVDPEVSEAPEVSTIYRVDGLRDMLSKCDIVVACCPETEENHHMLSRGEFGVMRRGGYFINVGRGAVVDEAALCEALRSGHLAGAGLDVVEEEPYPANGPLWELPGVLVTAHSSAHTQHLVRRKIDFFLANLRRYDLGEPLLNRIDLTKGY